MLKETELLRLYDRELRIEIEQPGLLKETFPGLVRFTRPAPGMSYVLYSRLALDELDAAIEAQIAHFAGLSRPFTWKVFDHDQPPELEARLLQYGFERDDDPDAILALEISAAAPVLFQPPRADIRRLEAPDQAAVAALVEQRVYGGDFDWLAARLGADLQVQDYLEVYAAYVGDEPVSAGWIYLYPGSQFAVLFGGATMVDFRGRGIYTDLVAARLQAALRRGRRFLATGASDQSRPILLRLGFQQIATERDFIWEPD